MDRGEWTDGNKEKITRKQRRKDFRRMEKSSFGRTEEEMGGSQRRKIIDHKGGVKPPPPPRLVWLRDFWSVSVCPCFDQIPGVRVQSWASVGLKCQSQTYKLLGYRMPYPYF